MAVFLVEFQRAHDGSHLGIVGLHGLGFTGEIGQHRDFRGPAGKLLERLRAGDNDTVEFLRGRVGIGYHIRDADEIEDRIIRGRLPEKEREFVRDEIRQEKDKIVSEERLRQVQSEVTKHDKDFQYCLKMAAATLSAGQPGQARDWIEKAVGCEQRALKMFEEMQEIEGKLLSLTKKEYKAFKREKTFAQEG